MLSASHNPMPDNGIKFFARGGHKLDDAIEDAIEQRLREPWERPTGGAVGRVDDVRAAVERVRRPPGRDLDRPLDGLQVVLDCAARRRVRRRRRRRSQDAGAERGRDPRRARRPEHQRRLRLHPPRRRCARPCVEHEADAGFALDGDADRCLAVDHDGRRRRRRPDPGDPRARACASAASSSADTVVATVMSNLGFVQAMRAVGHRGPADQGRRPLRARGDAGRRATPSAASSPGT